MHLDEATKNKLNNVLGFVKLKITTPSTGGQETLCREVPCPTCSSYSDYTRSRSGKYHMQTCSGHDYYPFLGSIEEHIGFLPTKAKNLAGKEKGVRLQDNFSISGTMIINAVVNKGDYFIVKGMISDFTRFTRDISFIAKQSPSVGVYAYKAKTKGYFKDTLNLKEVKLKPIPIDMLKRLCERYAEKHERQDEAVA